MYIRWKQRACKNWHRGVTLSAYLVQSERVNGKPRQKVLAFLGNVGEYTLHPHLNVVARERFWRKAHTILQSLTLSEEEQARICESLAQKIPPLSEEERANNHILTPRKRRDVVP